MECGRRLYKGNSYDICFPLTDSGVTLARFYTLGDIIIEKEPEFSGDSMCFSFSEEDLAALPDGVLRYEIVTEYETIDTNSPYVVVTQGDYSGQTIDDLLSEAYESGFTEGYDSGYTDGLASCSGQTYENMPFTLEAAEDNVILAVPSSYYSQINDGPLKDPEYHITEQDVKEFVPWLAILPKKGDTLKLWSSSASTQELFTGDFPLWISDRMSQRGTFIVYGNIMSLQYGFDFQDQNVLKWDFHTRTSDYQPGSRIGLFWNCDRVLDASNLILPATTLVPYAYASMFFNSANLTGTPELPATTLVEGCYYCMYFTAQKVNHIRCLATDTSASRCTVSWLYGVSSTGTFETPSTTTWRTGQAGIPEGWTRVDSN